MCCGAFSLLSITNSAARFCTFTHSNRHAHLMSDWYRYIESTKYALCAFSVILYMPTIYPFRIVAFSNCTFLAIVHRDWDFANKRMSYGRLLTKVKEVDKCRQKVMEKNESNTSHSSFHRYMQWIPRRISHSSQAGNMKLNEQWKQQQRLYKNPY